MSAEQKSQSQHNPSKISTISTKIRFLQRGPDKPFHTSEQSRAAARVKHLMRIYRDQHPHGLPNNELGVKYARYAIRTMAAYETVAGRERWLQRNASWMDMATRAELVGMSAKWYSPKSLGNKLELDDDDRERLKVWTIEAFDISPAQRKAINLRKHKESQQRYRRKSGADPREQYLAKNAKSREKPWKALGIGRTKYYELGLHTPRGQVRDGPLLLCNEVTLSITERQHRGTT